MSDPAVAFEAPSNLNTTIFDFVIQSDNVADRLALTRQLCDLVLDENTSSADRTQVMPSLIRLACDTDKDVRGIISAKLAMADNLSADLVFAIIADDDDVAIPFIRLNPSIDCTAMLAILAVGDEARCSGVAARNDIPAEVVKKIMHEGKEDTVLTLMNNPSVRLGARYCRKIYNRFYKSHRICSCLMEMPQLPAEIALVHNQYKAEQMRKASRLKGWVADFKSDDYISDEEEINALHIIANTDIKALPTVVAIMSQRGMLTTSLLIRAGIDGKIAFFEWALSYLSSTSLRKVRSVMRKNSARAATSLFNKAGLPEDSHDIMNAVCKVAAAIGKVGRNADSDAFGRALVEVIMTDHAADEHHERVRIIALLAQFSQGRTRNLVTTLQEGLLKAA